MRSRTPKVLHELCGTPMVLWPVRAAREAGAGRIVVVDSPARALAGVLGDDVSLAVQPVADGTGGAVVAAMAELDAADARPGAGAGAGDGQPGEAPVLVLSGDVPLLSAESIRSLAEAHERSGAAATMVTSVLDDPRGYGRVVRDADGGVLRVVETKHSSDATPEELEIH